MQLVGIRGVVRGRHTTTTTRRSAQQPVRHPDLVNRCWSAPTAPDQWWVADFSYVDDLLGCTVPKFDAGPWTRRFSARARLLAGTG